MRSSYIKLHAELKNKKKRPISNKKTIRNVLFGVT